MPVSPGTRIGPYEVLSALGAGGMGEVYRARDPKLNREVALKILPADFALDADRRARFTREAQLLASLNHPNIAAIYGFEDSGDTHALVLELVEGETLADHIARGPIPLDKALPIARQICEALEAAHEHGVIHRDLKPANIKLRPDGTVKVLDFGLAKLAGPPEGGPHARTVGAGFSPPEMSLSPTITSPALMTGIGVLLGTAAYMAPEQARGKAVDKRADIWAFGCVLFETLTATRPFEGDETTDVIVAIVSRQPDWSKLPRSVPARLRELLERCLEKDPRDRLRDVGDALLEINTCRRTPGAAREKPLGTSRRHSRGIAVAVALLTTATLGGFAGWQVRPGVVENRAPVRFSFPLPPLAAFVLNATDITKVAMSPDGLNVAYAGNGQLYVRKVDQFEGIPVRNSDGGDTPFFSSDSRWLGFHASGRLQRVSLAGGAPITITNVGTVIGAAWGPDDTIVFGGGVGAGLQQVPAAGGKTIALTIPDSAKGEVNHGLPHFLPNGRDVVFTIGTGDGSRIAVLSRTDGSWREILQPGGDGRYVSTGHLVFTDTGNLRVVPFDLNTSTVTGPVAPAIDGIVWQNLAGLESAWFALSQRGDLVYVTGSLPEVSTKPVWVERTGREIETIDVPPATYLGPVISGDGQRVAFSRIGTNGIGQVWVLNVDRNRLVPVPSQGADYNAIWRPGRADTLTYTSNGDLFETTVDASGPPTRVMSREHYQVPSSWSPDGHVLAFMDMTPSRIEVWTMELGRSPQRLFDSTANIGNPTFSPKGNLLAYVSDETGRYEVYVRQYPGSGRGTQVSKDGGLEPVWSPNGGELFYRNGDRMMAVRIATQPMLRPDPPVELWRHRYFSQDFLRPNYHVASDGRFLMLQVDATVASARTVNVVLNWSDELKRLVR